MANFYLDTNGISELGQSSTAVRVNGTAGDKDQILLLANAANINVGPAVEIVDFAGSVADYQFVTSADGGIAVYRGATLVANVGLNPNTSELRFAEGGLTLTQDPETGAITVGGQEVSGERAEYTGDGMLTGQEHQTRVDGGDGPAGPGETYTLPKDLGAANLITSGTGNDTFNTDMNGLRPNAQIVDESTTDRDVLNLHYNTLNTNKQIVNVETINAIWEGVSDGQFDAKQVSHAGDGTNIVVSTTKSTAKNFVVKEVKANTVTAGDGVTGTVEAQNVKGGTVDIGGASGLILTAPSGTVDVKASRDFTLDATDVFTKSKPLTISSDEDITIKAGLQGGVKSESYIQAAGKGDIILDTGLDGGTNKGDISHMTGFKAIGVKGQNGGDAEYTVSAGQTVLFTTDDDGTNKAGFSTDGKAGNLNVQLGMIAGERDLGKLDISGGGLGKNNQVSVLNIDVNNQNVVIEDLIGDGGSGSLTKEPGADVFTLSGRGDATVKAMSSGGTVDASALEGTLTLGGDGSGSNPAPIAVGAANEGVAVAAGKAGSDVYVGNVDAGLFFLAGGDGADTLTLSGEVKDSNELNKATVTAVLGGGDDVVILQKGFELEASNGSLSLDFGEGRDVLEVAKDAEEIDLTNGSAKKGVSLVGFESLKIGENATLKVNASSLGSAPAFELLSDGLTIVYDKKAGRNLDLSGVKGSSDATKPVVEVEVTEGLVANGAVTLGDGLAERVKIMGDDDRTGGIVLSNIVTLKNFTANGVDMFAFEDEGSKIASKTNIHKGGNGSPDNGFFTNADLPGATTLKARLDVLADKLADAGAGAYAFYSDGTDTYVLACGGEDSGDPIVNAVRLEGTNYTSAALTGSMGFVSDDEPNTTLLYSVNGSLLEVPDGATQGYTILVDKDYGGDSNVKVTGGDEDDSLFVTKGNETSAGALVVNMGEGDDTVTLNADLTFQDASVLTLDGGDGNDTLSINGGKLDLYSGGDIFKADASGSVSITGFEKVMGSLVVGANTFSSTDGQIDPFALSGSVDFILGEKDTALDISQIASGGTAEILVDATGAAKPAEIVLSVNTAGIKETVKIKAVAAGNDSSNAVKITSFKADSEDILDLTELSLTDVVIGTSVKSATFGNSLAETLAGLDDIQDASPANVTAGSTVALSLTDGTDSFIVFGTIDSGTDGQFDTGEDYFVIQLVGETTAPTLDASFFAGVTFA